MSENNIRDQQKEDIKPIATANTSDLPDSPEDVKNMEEEELIMDLPDVEDIPGQENIIPPKMNEFMDTTISSSDEEGDGLFNEGQIDDEE